MMRLFGGFGEECFGVYADEYPLADGWRERVPLHQLAPLVVHAIKFGGGYVAGVEDASGSAALNPVPFNPVRRCRPPAAPPGGRRR